MSPEDTEGKHEEADVLAATLKTSAKFCGRAESTAVASAPLAERPR